MLKTFKNILNSKDYNKYITARTDIKPTIKLFDNYETLIMVFIL